ncbi:thiamine diphosphate-binding protein [Lipomyces orientalis]|uniref:Thiamine diphosphate-binding protein n=1 Tax=Lipomyces orientalis TaxID=1233043 RepID=A0ACC3TMA3_9ASCO
MELLSIPRNCANIVVDSLYNAGVRLVFGIPGAKVDGIFDALLDHPAIRLIVCRHEQNAVFMAAAVGRITGHPGVCIATSGPGASNLTTGLATATTEGDPVVAIIGSVSRLQSTKRTHQSMRALDVLNPICKETIGIEVEDQVAEVMLDAFRGATSYPRGATVVSLPLDIAKSESKIPAFPSVSFSLPDFGPSPISCIESVGHLIEEAKLPVLFLGMRSTAPQVVAVIRNFLKLHPMPVVETFQAAGAVSRELVNLFYGRVGLFRNQPGDKLLAKSDLVLTVGYDPTEYDANLWNVQGKLRIVHIDYQTCDFGFHYRPIIELIGSIEHNIKCLAANIRNTVSHSESEICRSLYEEFHSWRKTAVPEEVSGLVKPLHFISCLQRYVSPTTTVTCDVGTVYIYMMRYFFAYEPGMFLTSNGQQTLGVSLPWAIAASLVQEPPCSKKVVSLSGDGGFMFSSQELSTAVQLKCNITHFIWNDGHYNMVEFQEELKYGRSSGIALGGVDFVRFAEAFDAKGFRIHSEDEVESVMREALAYEGVSIVDVSIDYSRNQELASNIIPEEYK